jgi:hypothetical protein
MKRNAFVIALAAGLLMLGSSSQVHAWGAAHVGYTHVGPGGVQHYGATAAVGPGGAYGGAHASAYGAGSAYHAGYGSATTYGGTAAYHSYAPNSGGAYAVGGYHYGGAYSAGVYRHY